MYTPRPEDVKRIANDFIGHSPTDEHQLGRFVAVRDFAHNFASYLLTVCPPSRELSLALTNLEQTMFWANASIAREVS